MSLLFKLFVTLCALFISIDLFKSWRARRVSFGFFLFFSLAAIAAVIFVFLPSVADALFGSIGIGSGVNGAFFVAIWALIYIVKSQYKTIVRLERQQTEIVRRLSLQNLNDRNDS